MLFGKDLYTQIPLTEATPPALPSLSPQVWQAAFVHSSKNIDNIPRSKFRYAEDFADNERLEWVGDALLYSIVANYLFRTYPKLRVSYLSAIRQRMVQNATLAKFARLYKMDQALILGEGSERYRNDLKTLADTFEAFVGAVHQVHGLALTTRWIEDLIRPYATELYEHYARMYGENTRAEEELAAVETSPAPSAASSERRWRRFCGFIPLPTFWSKPETKSILGHGSREQSYGTLVPVSQVASNQAYTRLPQEDEASSSSNVNKIHGANGPSAPALKKGKPQDGSQVGNAAASASSTNVSAVKRSKSRDRVAFTPPSVSNMESLKSAQKKAKQAGSNSLSDGELPRMVPGLPKFQPQTPKQARVAPVEDSKAKVKTASERPETVVFDGKATGHTTNANNAAPTATNGWTVSQNKQADTPSGAPTWGAEKNVTFAPAVTTPISKAATDRTDTKTMDSSNQKAILRRPSETPVGQPPTNGAVKTLSQAQSGAERSPAVTEYLDALTMARSDPVAFLESHHLFNIDKNRKARALDYDDNLSTPKKCIVQVKVDGRVVSESAAAAQDSKLAKARAAFKAIDALSLLPDPPKELTDNGGIVKPTELAIPSNTVWLPDLKKPMPQVQAQREAEPSKGVSSDFAAESQMASAKSEPASNGLQMKKQLDMIANPPGPFPGTVYASLPTGGKGSSARYYITSVKGFGGGTYHAILNGDLELIGQAASSKKATAIEEAERMAKVNADSGRKLSKTAWTFVDCSKTGKLAKKVNIMPHAKANTGAVPLLTHATTAEPKEDARIIWLEWYAEEKKAWKCVTFADAIYFGSGKNVDRKAALTAASAKALDELERVQDSM